MIHVYHAKMKELILIAGIKEKRWDKLLKIEAPSKVEEAIKLLDALFHGEWKTFYNIRYADCATPELWDNAKAMGITLKEHVIYYSAKKALKLRVQEIFDLLKKKKNGPAEKKE
jgi:hypothetical protein